MRVTKERAAAFLLLLSPASAFKKPSNAILLSKVSTLTFRDGSKTTGRRLAPIPQMSCQGPGCKHYNVDVMRCKNAGSDYGDEDIQWTCTASIPEEFRLGSTDVTCEGYDNADDPYVLKGSCGVRYNLQLTSKGTERFGSGGFWGKSGRGKASPTSSEDLAGYLFMALFAGILGWIVWSIYSAWNTPAGQRPGNRAAGYGGWGGGGGGGGGGGVDSDDPPPPYNPRAKPEPSNTAGQQQQGWRPGFWTGLLGGAAATHFASNRTRNIGYDRYQAPRQTSGWFGGNNGNTYGSGEWASPARSVTRASSSNSSSYGPSRHESTGFGSTSRR